MSQLFSLKLRKSLQSIPLVGIPRPDFERRAPGPIESDIQSDIAESNIISTQINSQVGPSILTVTLHEANGISAAVRDEEKFNVLLSRCTEHQDRKSPWLGLTYQPYHQEYLPYVVLHFDHSETFAGSIAGTTENPIWAGRAIRWKFDVSPLAKLTVHLYIKSPHAFEEGTRSVWVW